MRFFIDDVEVLFPYPYIYPEQYEYMRKLKSALDVGGPCILEMPSGTGKTVTLLSFLISYKYCKPQNTSKIIYCSRTISEIEKAIEEAKIVIAYRQTELGSNMGNILCLSMASRRNLCIHSDVISSSSTSAEVDSKCRDLTNEWVRDIEDAPHCNFFENFENQAGESILKGVYSLDDLKDLGTRHSWCPYFLARKMINYADLVIFSYQYVIDPKISQLISNEFSNNSIVVFDEAHNIDSACIDAMSITITINTLQDATKNLATIEREIEKAEDTKQHRLEAEYAQLVQGLNLPSDLSRELLSSPVLEADTIKEMVPGNIRKSRHFLGLLRRLIEQLKKKLEKAISDSESPRSFLFDLVKHTLIDPQHLRFCSARLRSLTNTLQLKEIHQFSAISQICDFATMIGTYSKGFVVITETFTLIDSRNSQIQFSCLDASIAMSPVLLKYKSTIITSGTLSPLDMYPKILNFKPVISERLKMTIHRPCLLPLIISKGSDQTPLSTRYEARKDRSVTRNYGTLLVEMCNLIPDGIVCFFTSYKYLGDVVCEWNEMGILNLVLTKKLLFIETSDPKETSLALDNYRKACDNGRGAVLFSVARGKVSEGIDFDHHYGRCVIMFGLPFVYSESPILKARLQYLRDSYDIKESDFFSFDAMRTAAQCVGRIIRGKSDYGVMIFADKRFTHIDKRNKLPQWIAEQMPPRYINISTDVSTGIISQFLREMAQPTNRSDEIGKSLWTIQHVLQFQHNNRFSSSHNHHHPNNNNNLISQNNNNNNGGGNQQAVPNPKSNIIIISNHTSSNGNDNRNQHDNDVIMVD